MKVFIAGATGVLGRRVVSKLVDRGHQVVGLSRSDKNRELLQRSHAEPRFGDLFNREEIIRLSADCSVILHLATAIPTKARPSHEDWSLNDRIRREGTGNLIAAAEKNNCELYVQQSVTFVYGNRNGDWVDEMSAVAESQPTMLVSALDMEKIVLDGIAQKELRAIILRFGMFYSHDSSHTVAMLRAIQRRRLPIIAGGRVYWNIINVDDAADAVVRAVDMGGKRSGSIYNICDDEPPVYRDLVNAIADLLSVKRPRSIPEFIARVGIGSDALSFLLSSVRCRNQKAKAEMQWKPTYPTYREGIRAEIEQWLNQAPG